MDENTIYRVELSKIKIRPNRYRKDMGDIEGLAENIKDVGLLNPIILDTDHHLIAGERRLRAFHHLKMDAIPAIFKSTESIESSIFEAIENIFRKDFNWKEQVVAMEELHVKMSAVRPGWSMRKTASEIGVSKSGMIGDIELAKALRAQPDVFEGCSTKKGAIKALQQFKIDEAHAELALRRTSTNYGRSAGNCIFMGDCEELIQKIPDGVVNLLGTDPPYGLGLDKIKRYSSSSAEVMLDRIYSDDEWAYKDMIERLMPQFYRVMATSSWIFIFCGAQHSYWLYNAMINSGFSVDPIPGIWNKVSMTGQTNHPDKYFARTYETFVYGCKGSPSLVRQGLSNVITFPVVPAIEKDMPVEKPVILLEELISRFCLPGNLILDPFCGSGSTIVAAIKRGCKGIGFEKMESTYNIALLKVAEALRMKDAGRIDLLGGK